MEVKNLQPSQSMVAFYLSFCTVSNPTWLPELKKIEAEKQ